MGSYTQNPQRTWVHFGKQILAISCKQQTYQIPDSCPETSQIRHWCHDLVRNMSPHTGVIDLFEVFSVWFFENVAEKCSMSLFRLMASGLKQYIYDSFHKSTTIDVLGCYQIRWTDLKRGPNSLVQFSVLTKCIWRIWGTCPKMSIVFRSMTIHKPTGVGKETPQNTCDAKPAIVFTIRLLSVTMV